MAGVGESSDRSAKLKGSAPPGFLTGGSGSGYDLQSGWLSGSLVTWQGNPNRVDACVKAAIAWRAAYEPIAAEIIEVDTPGVTGTDLSRFTFRHLHLPIYPLDPGVRYSEGG